jgi:hypothetical protein
MYKLTELCSSYELSEGTDKIALMQVNRAFGRIKVHLHSFEPWYYTVVRGYAVARLVEALCCKPEGRGFDFRWFTEIFHWHNPSDRTMALGLTQPKTEKSRADNLTTFMCQLSWNLGVSVSWNPRSLSRPVMGLLYLYLYLY